MSTAQSEEELLRLLTEGADDFDQLAHSVGYFVLLWASAEQWLDMCVAVVYRGLGGDGLAKRLPTHLKPKLAFMEACFDALPALATIRGRGRRVVSGFSKLSSTRHEFIHGAIRDAFAKGTKYEFYKFDLVDGKIHETRMFTLELRRQAPKLHEQALLLQQRSMDLFYRLHQLWKRILLKGALANTPKGTRRPRFIDLPPEGVLMRKRPKGRKKDHAS